MSWGIRDVTPVKVLHLNSGNLYGGVETMLHTLAECRELAPAMQPSFGLCFPGRHADELRTIGVPVHLLGGVRFSRPWTVWAARRRLIRLLKSEPYDIVFCHQPWIQALFGASVVRCNRGYIAHLHGEVGRGWQERQALATSPGLVIAPSQNVFDTLGDAWAGVPREVVHNPLPTRLLTKARLTNIERAAKRAALDSTADDIVVIMVSRVEPLKGPDVVLEALIRLKEIPRWKFWYVGEPQRPHEHDLFAKLQTLAQQVPGRVTFLGSRSDVPELLQLADIYAQGNRIAEGFGLTFVEAGIFNLPVVTTAPAALGEAVGPDCARIVPSNHPEAMADALHELMTDPVIRQKLGATGRARAEQQCDPARQLARLATLAASLTSRRSPACYNGNLSS